MSRRTWKECTLFMFYCTINHEENSFSLPLWSVGRIPSKKKRPEKGAKEWLRNANQRKDSHLARTVDFWQYLTRTGRIYNLDIYNSFFKNTEEIYRILNWWTASEIKPIVYLFVTNEVSYQYQGGKLVIVWKYQYPYQGGLISPAFNVL